MKKSPRAGQAQQIAAAAGVVFEHFFKPATDLLLELLDHDQAGVQVYAIVLLADLVIENMPAIPLEALAEVSFRLRQRWDDPDPRVRASAKKNLVELMEAAAEYGATCKAAQQEAAERN